MDKKLMILDHKQIGQKINRMAYQILEDCFDEKEICIAGIQSRGYILAGRLKSVLEDICTIKITLIAITIDKDSDSLVAGTDVDIDKCRNKAIIIADDVLNSGRTLAYGIGVFLNIPTKKLRTAVLVDRSHKLFPIQTDFAGFTVSTVSKEHITVEFGKKQDAAYLS
jgi:pyrimidine operon attenuation protein/uracil phosphoribosyltransferase